MKNLINDVATEARALLNGILADCDTDDTTGTCLFASLLLARLAHSKGLLAVIRGGDGKADGGLFTMHGGYGHYWCEISINDEFHIVDISADQFGFEGVIVKSINEAEAPSVRIVVTPIENTNDKMGTDRETNFTRT